MKTIDVMNGIAEEIRTGGFDPEVAAVVIEKLFTEEPAKNAPGSLDQQLVNIAQRRASEKNG